MIMRVSPPASLQEFIPECERAPKAFAEAWRYTPVAGQALAFLPPTTSDYTIAADTTLNLAVTNSTVTHIQVQPGATLLLLEDVSAGPLLSQLTINVMPNGHVQHVRQTHASAQEAALLQSHIKLGAGASYNGYVLTTGAARLRQRIEIDLNGKEASASIAGAYVLENAAHSDIAVLMNHKAPNCRSRQHIKGVAKDNARAAFQGKIHVAKGADDTEAYQLHKAMLLSPRAEVNAKPELEIFADRVKCSHGNAIGALDAAALFYLQTRGVDRSAAQQLLLRAFLAETVADAPAQHEVLEARLNNLLEAWHV